MTAYEYMLASAQSILDELKTKDTYIKACSGGCLLRNDGKMIFSDTCRCDEDYEEGIANEN